MALFVGQFQHTLDVKGRLVLPVKYRADFEFGGYLSPAVGGCMSMWTREAFEAEAAIYASQRSDVDADSLRRSRYFLANSFEVEVDRQGRFALPSKAREIGHLDGEVLIVGQYDHLELWAPSRFTPEVELPGSSLMGSSAS
jgi:MraZ protein